MSEVVKSAETKKKFRKRPNKAEILKGGELRGHLTHNEETTLKGLTVKNTLQRIYTKTFDDSVNKTDCEALQKAMDEFNAVVQSVLSK